MIFDEFRLPEVWDSILPDVRHIKPFVRLCGFDPNRWEDIEGVAFTLAQIEFFSDAPYIERYDGPVYRLRDAGKRIVDALYECTFKRECEDASFHCGPQGLCACQDPEPRSGDRPQP